MGHHVEDPAPHLFLETIHHRQDRDQGRHAQRDPQHGTHGYLVAEFLSPLTDRRTDKYGADRALFAIEIV
ncbi:MAG TPA: hypothetical protein EYP40_06040, partial [Chromatiales bacterium]|nr:hypothetical protein [Chromatiales bacterium]